MRIYRDIGGDEVAFPFVGSPRQGMVMLTMTNDGEEYMQDMGNARQFSLNNAGEADHPRRTMVMLQFAYDDTIYRFVFDTEEEAKELYEEFKPYLGMRMVPNVLEVPEDASGLQKLTWTIAEALNQYDPEIDAHGDGAEIIDFINGYGVQTPM